MKNEKYIVVEIDENGDINAETFNFKGPGCVDLLNGLMKDLALITGDEKKPDYFESEVKNKEKVYIKK
jgi:hypothetical protein